MQILAQYDINAPMGMMIDFALADKFGQSVVAEYIENEVMVTQTPAVTNFYIAEGEKNGIGSAKSHQRDDILMQTIDVLAREGAMLKFLVKKLQLKQLPMW